MTSFGRHLRWRGAAKAAVARTRPNLRRRERAYRPRPAPADKRRHRPGPSPAAAPPPFRDDPAAAQDVRASPPRGVDSDAAGVASGRRWRRGGSGELAHAGRSEARGVGQRGRLPVVRPSRTRRPSASPQWPHGVSVKPVASIRSGPVPSAVRRQFRPVVEFLPGQARRASAGARP